MTQEQAQIKVVPAILFAFSYNFPYHMGEMRIEVPKTKAVLLEISTMDYRYMLSNNPLFEGGSYGLYAYRDADLHKKYGDFNYSWAIRILRGRITDDDADFFGVADFMTDDYHTARVLITAEGSYLSKNVYDQYLPVNGSINFARKLRNELSLFDF